MTGVTGDEKVRVRVYTLATLYTLAGRYEHTLTLPRGSTILDALKMLARGNPRLAQELLPGGRPNPEVNVLHNGRPTPHERLHQVILRDGDTIHLIPPAAGGTCPGVHGTTLNHGTRRKSSSKARIVSTP